MSIAKTFKKENTKKDIRISKTHNATDAIGVLEKNMDIFVLTYGQFSLIDSLIAILDQTGPADVVISSWTAADAHLERSAQLIESADIRSFRMIVDRSFKTRQPKYYYHMIKLFGHECIRSIRTHAKFMVIKNDEWNIVVRTSMNLNENPRLENIEISESKEFTDFFLKVTDDLFNEVKPEENKSQMLDLDSVPELKSYKLIEADHIKRSSLNVPRTTHSV